MQNNALRAGIAYLAIVVVGMFAFVYALPSVVVEGDPGATLQNIGSNPSLFRLGILSVVVMNIVSVLAATYLYRLLESVDRDLAGLMFSLLVIGATISLMAESMHGGLLHVAGQGDQDGSRQTAGLLLAMHDFGAHTAVVFWGLWLLPMALLLRRLGSRLSSFIAVTLVIAGCGYLLDAIVKIAAPESIGLTFSDVTFAGELLLTLWLLLGSGQVLRLVAAATGTQPQPVP